MQKVFLVTMICLLGTVLLVGQSNQQQAPAQSQQPSQAQQPQSQPNRETSVSGSVSVQSRQGQNQPGQAAEAPRQPARGGGGGSSAAGVPWVWVVLGFVALVAIILALVARGPAAGPVERVEHHYHDHDDIHRAA